MRLADAIQLKISYSESDLIFDPHDVVIYCFQNVQISPPLFFEYQIIKNGKLYEN